MATLVCIHVRTNTSSVQCRKTFSATTRTAFYRLRTAAEAVALIVTLLTHGCPVHVIAVAFGFDARPIAAWWACPGRHQPPVEEISGQASYLNDQDISSHTLQALITALHISIDYLLGLLDTFEHDSETESSR